MKEKLKMDYSSFLRLKQMLSGGEEDQNVALETLYNMIGGANMNNSEVILTLLGKSLAHNGRYTLMNDERFKGYFLVEPNQLEWQILFPIIKKHLKPEMELEQKIMRDLVIKLVKDHLLYDNFHNIIRDIKIELNI
tara:strand:- start:1786 stop:2193 length:408 start_codon:yes stop_codon:yes gene_type:complete